MPQLSAAEIRQFIERHVELWNAGEKEPWLAHMKSASAGGLTMEDPVGTPVKRGPDVMSEAWDAAFNEYPWQLTIEHLVVCANEIAVVIRNEGEVKGAPVTVHSIETYKFGNDGSMQVRTYFDIPTGSAYGEWTSTTGG
jgi:hypothetical protein